MQQHSVLKSIVQLRRVHVCSVLQRWMDAMEEHSAYSTHYCSQDQGSEEDEEEVLSVGELTESLQVKYQSTTCLSDSCYLSVAVSPHISILLSWSKCKFSFCNFFK